MFLRVKRFYMLIHHGDQSEKCIYIITMRLYNMLYGKIAFLARARLVAYTWRSTAVSMIRGPRATGALY